MVLLTAILGTAITINMLYQEIYFRYGSNSDTVAESTLTECNDNNNEFNILDLED